MHFYTVINTKLNCYKAMVRPVLEYASPVWDPNTAININLLESVQRSAARLCYKDYSSFSSVTTMLENLYLPTLKVRRSRAKLQMMYKVTNNLVSVYRIIVWFRLPLSCDQATLINWTPELTVLNFHFYHVQSNYGHIDFCAKHQIIIIIICFKFCGSNLHH